MALVAAVAASDRALGLEVGEQRKAELALVPKGDVTPDSVDRDADELRVVATELVVQLVVDGELIAAHRAEVGGVEDEHQRAAAEIRQRHRLVGRGLETEVGRLLARRQDALCAHARPR